MMQEVALVLTTAVTVGAAIAAVAVWAFKAVVAKDVTPTLVELSSGANALTREFTAFREIKAEERAETRAILKDLDLLVRDLNTRVTVLEQRRAA